MSTSIIRRAFETRLAAWAAAQTPPLLIAYENARFTAPAGIYLRAFMLESPTISSTIDRLHREFGGIFQVSVVGAPLGGIGAVQAAAEAIAALYPTNVPIEQDGVKIWLEEPMSLGPTIMEADRAVKPVSCPYHCDVFVGA